MTPSRSGSCHEVDEAHAGPLVETTGDTLLLAGPVVLVGLLATVRVKPDVDALELPVDIATLALDPPRVGSLPRSVLDPGFPARGPCLLAVRLVAGPDAVLLAELVGADLEDPSRGVEALPSALAHLTVRAAELDAVR